MKILAPTPEGVAEAAEVLRAGAIVAYPTETVYGLAVDPMNEAALDKLYAAKGRPESNPVLMVIANVAQAEAVVSEFSPLIRSYMDRFWPGPLSLLLPAREGIPLALTAGTAKVCLRCSAHPIARDLAAAFGGPITSTSANRHGEAPARAVDELDIAGVDYALDGGRLLSETTSTIFDPVTGTVLRAGVIPESELISV